MARRRQTSTESSEAEKLQLIEAWYRGELAGPAVPSWSGSKWTPVAIGPTWQIEDGHWILPERTIGWAALAWCGRWLQQEVGVPWRFTLEQARIILWWYAVDENGDFIYTDGVLQRLKGWGKDPFGACLCMFELLGDCRVLKDGDGRPVWGPTGDPVGTPAKAPWVQTAAVAMEQTKNTMRLLPALVTAEAKAKFGVMIGKEQVYALGSTALFQALTNSPLVLEGARATLVLMNETQHWVTSNGGHEMADVIERNATKSPDGAARTLKITNAFEPGEDSVAEHDREAYDAMVAGKAFDSGIFYDSLEADPNSPLTEEDAPSVVESIRGDSTWLNIKRIVKSILDVRNPPSRSRRFWYNQITAAEDAWMDPLLWDTLARPGELVAPGETIAMFFDGSKSDDATGLVGCRISDGFVFTLGVWQKPGGWDERDNGPWRVDRDSVNRAVDQSFELYRPVIFYGDPSDTRDDETAERYWDTLLDRWHAKYHHRLKVHAQKTGGRQHSIIWDMRSPARQEEFTLAAKRFISDCEANDLSHDGGKALTWHVKNARRRPNKYGVSLGKANRESPKKVDLAVCAVGARMARREYLNQDTGKKRTGKVW